jgi:hypothetical protein
LLPEQVSLPENLLLLLPATKAGVTSIFINGVATNGVSGGPVVYSAEAVIPEAPPASSTQEPHESVRRLSTQYRQACAASQPGLEAL